jgi:predicted ribosomally synthesized peptide with nif11-like leader
MYTPAPNCGKCRDPGSTELTKTMNRTSLKTAIRDMSDRGRKKNDMKVNIEKLAKIASLDEKLSVKLQKASKEQVVVLAKEHGITLTEADFEAPQGAVSDDELEAAAGGGNCICALGGGGKAGEGEKTCACVLVGLGYYTGGGLRCSCANLGSGVD